MLRFSRRKCMTYINKRFPPRRPTDDEVKAIVLANYTQHGDDYEPEYIAVWDHYISDGPGYCGWVALAFGGEPDFCSAYALDKDGIVEVCSFGDGLHDKPMNPTSVGHPDRFDDQEFGGGS